MSCPDFASQPFFDGLARGEVLLQHCPSCARHQFPAREICVRCGARALEWVNSDGLGSLHAFTVMHRAPEESFADLVPYAVGLVELDEGLRIMARAAVPPDQISIGMRSRIFPDPEPRLGPCLLFRPEET